MDDARGIERDRSIPRRYPGLPAIDSRPDSSLRCAGLSRPWYCQAVYHPTVRASRPRESNAVLSRDARGGARRIGRVRSRHAPRLRFRSPPGHRRRPRRESRSIPSRYMKSLFDGIPLDRVSVSMTIERRGAAGARGYIVSGTEQGVSQAALRHHPNDIVKDSGLATLHLSAAAVDADRRRHHRVHGGPYAKFNSISISGYHIQRRVRRRRWSSRSRSRTAWIVRAALSRGMKVDELRRAAIVVSSASA